MTKFTPEQVAALFDREGHASNIPDLLAVIKADGLRVTRNFIGLLYQVHIGGGVVRIQTESSDVVSVDVEGSGSRAEIERMALTAVLAVGLVEQMLLECPPGNSTREFLQETLAALDEAESKALVTLLERVRGIRYS